MKNKSFIILILLSLISTLVFAGQPTKIAVAAADKTPAAVVSEQAGPSPYFLLFDQKGKLLEAVENPYRNADGAGPSVMNFLAEKGATVVVAGRFGPRILETMKSKGVTAVTFKGSAADAVKQVTHLK